MMLMMMMMHSGCSVLVRCYGLIGCDAFGAAVEPYSLLLKRQFYYLRMCFEWCYLVLRSCPCGYPAAVA